MEAGEHFHGVTAAAAFDMPFERNVDGLTCDSCGKRGEFAGPSPGSSTLYAWSSDAPSGMMNVPMVERVSFSFSMHSAESVNLSVLLFLLLIAVSFALLTLWCPTMTSGWG